MSKRKYVKKEKQPELRQVDKNEFNLLLKTATKIKAPENIKNK